MSARVSTKSRRPDEHCAGVGVDLCSVHRTAAAMRRTPGLVARICTESEIARLERLDPGDRPPVLARMFAVKESVMKALGCGFDTVPFDCIEVDVDLCGVRLRGTASDRAATLGIASFEVDLVVLEGPDGPAVLATVLASCDL